MRIALPGSLIASFAVFMAAACGSSSPDDPETCLPYCTDSGGYGDTGSLAMDASTGNPDTGGSLIDAPLNDTGTCTLPPVGGPNGCNALAVTGPLVTATTLAADAGGSPMPTGGTIADGLYVLETIVGYGLTTAPQHWEISVSCGGTFWQYVVAGASDAPQGANVPVAFAGDAVSGTLTCGGDAGAIFPGFSYSAQPTHLTLFTIFSGGAAHIVFGFNKQ
jgi:hypothetical protein